MQFLFTKDAQTPRGVYSQGVKVGKYLFCAGARPVHPDSDLPVTGDFKTKVRCTLDNLQAVLKKGNASLGNVFSACVYLRNMADKPVVDEVFREYFKEGRFPSRVIVEISRLMDNHEIEIVCSAYVPESEEKIQYLNTAKNQILTESVSQAVRIGQYIFCSGARAVDPDTQELVQGDYRQRVRQCFENLKMVLAEGGATLADVYFTTVYVRNMADRPIVNEVMREYFQQGKFPLRIIVEISRLSGEQDIEVDCSAYLGPKEYLQTRGGHLPTGPFSQGVRIGEYVYCSGVRPLVPETQLLVEGDFETRVRRCLENIRAILSKGEADFSQVYTTTVYLRNMVNLPVVDKVFQEYFQEGSYPVRHVVEINRLNEGHDLEIACAAYLGVPGA
jgi:2-iminobutanoate/2-iminopropanoate deaminase